MDSTTSPNVDMEKIAKLQRMAAGVRTGGKGSVRRKKKAVHKAAPTDDKRLQSTLKRLQLNQLPGIEEVNIVRESNFIHFKNPKVQAQISANTYVVSGTAESKPLTEMMTSVKDSLSGLGGFGGLGKGGASMAQVQAMMEQLQAAGKMPQDLQEMAQAAQAAQAAEPTPDGEDDSEIPDLVSDANFEDAAMTEDAEPKTEE